MIVACPHCSAVYELPKRLLGPGGAAVRCPHCTQEFTLGADGEVVRPAETVAAPRGAEHAAAGRPRGAGSGEAARASRAPAAPAAGRTATEAVDPSTDVQAIARRVIEELASRKGPAMADANARGRLLSEFGPELVAAFEEFKKECGGTGNAAPFRDALRERWGIDLTPPASESSR
jgi:predicted Zn finger-like uncharacterized protein